MFWENRREKGTKERKFEMSNTLKKAKGKFIAIIIAVIIVVSILGVIVILAQKNGASSAKITELERKIIEMESRQVEVDAIKEEVREVSKYTAYEFDYTSIVHFSNTKTFQGVNIPLTGNKFIATIDGKMNIGIDADVVDITETKNSDGKVTKIVLTVPHSEIQDNYTMQDTLEIYDETNNIFNPVKITDYQELIVETEKKEEKKVQEGDILQQADERIKFLLTVYLQKVYGEDVEIECKYVQ